MSAWGYVVFLDSELHLNLLIEVDLRVWPVPRVVTAGCHKPDILVDLVHFVLVAAVGKGVHGGVVCRGGVGG